MPGTWCQGSWQVPAWIKFVLGPLEMVVGGEEERLDSRLGKRKVTQSLAEICHVPFNSQAGTSPNVLFTGQHFTEHRWSNGSSVTMKIHHLQAELRLGNRSSAVCRVVRRAAPRNSVPRVCASGTCSAQEQPPWHLVAEAGQLQQILKQQCHLPWHHCHETQHRQAPPDHQPALAQQRLYRRKEGNPGVSNHKQHSQSLARL